MAFALISRTGWGAKPAKSKAPMPGPQTDVFIHHTVGGSGPVDKEDDIMRGLQASAFGEGYSDIEYNFVVFPSGDIYTGRGWGLRSGATKGHNENSYAISHAGNYQNLTPTQAQVDATRWLIEQGQAKGFISKTPNIRGHRDVNATACPGNHLYARLADIRKPYTPVPPTYPPYRVTHKDGSSGVFKPPAPGQSAFPAAWARAEEIAKAEGWVQVERL